jgi:hypothetical protein
VLKWILGGVAVVVAVFLVIVALQPSDFRIERSATAWSPWEKVDPALQRAYDGPKAGTGAVYAWQGNKDVGEGRMTITESRPGELVRITATAPR